MSKATEEVLPTVLALSTTDRAELAEAVQRYENQRVGLGRDFPMPRPQHTRKALEAHEMVHEMRA